MNEHGKLRSTGERGSSAKCNEERLLTDKGPEIKKTHMNVVLHKYSQSTHTI